MWEIIRMWFLLRFTRKMLQNHCFDCGLAGKTTHEAARNHIIYVYASLPRISKNIFNRAHCLIHGHRSSEKSLDEHIDSVDRHNLPRRLKRRTENASRWFKLAENFEPRLVETEIVIVNNFIPSDEEERKMSLIKLTPQGETFHAPSNLLKYLIRDYWQGVLAAVSIFGFISYMVGKGLELIGVYLQNG